jgi:hypothetical protein
VLFDLIWPGVTIGRCQSFGRGRIFNAARSLPHGRTGQASTGAAAAAGTWSTFVAGAPPTDATSPLPRRSWNERLTTAGVWNLSRAGQRSSDHVGEGMFARCADRHAFMRSWKEDFHGYDVRGVPGTARAGRRGVAREPRGSARRLRFEPETHRGPAGGEASMVSMERDPEALAGRRRNPSRVWMTQSAP